MLKALSPSNAGTASLQSSFVSSRVQVAEQQSPSSVLPSSHCSLSSRVPLPQGSQVGSLLGSSSLTQVSLTSSQLSSVQISSSSQSLVTPLQLPLPAQGAAEVQTRAFWVEEGADAARGRLSQEATTEYWVEAETSAGQRGWVLAEERLVARENLRDPDAPWCPHRGP